MAEIGRAFRTIQLRLQQVKLAYEGIEVDPIDGEVVNIADMSNAAKALHEIGFEVLRVGADGKETFATVTELAHFLSDAINKGTISATELRKTIDALAGQRQSESLLALIKNMDEYERAFANYEDSAGSAMNEAMKQADSWDGRLNSLQNSWVKFVSSFGDIGNIARELIGALTGVLNVLSKITPILTFIGKSVAIPLLSKGIVALLNTMTNYFPTLMNNLNYVIELFINLENNTRKLTNATNTQNISVRQLIGSYQQMGNAASVANQKASPVTIQGGLGTVVSQGTIDKSAEKTGSRWGKITGQTMLSVGIATFTTGIMNFANSKQVDNIGDAIGNNIGSGIASGAMMGMQYGLPGALIGGGIGAIVSAISSAIGYYAGAVDRAIKKTNELNDEFEKNHSVAKENLKSIQNFEEDYKRLSKGINDYGETIIFAPRVWKHARRTALNPVTPKAA